MIRSPFPFRERILLFGGWGAGKSYAIESIARHCHVVVVDTDAAWARTQALSPDLDVEVVDVTDASWPEVLAAVSRELDPDAWLAVDMLGPLWDLCQEHYVSTVYGKDKAAYFLAAREQGRRGTLDGLKDWSVINAMWAQLANVLLRKRCHLVATAGARELMGELEDAEVRSVYGPLGVRPSGNKRMGHLFSTVVFMQKTKGGWSMTTVKDRGRKAFEREPVVDFAVQYLVGAGWEVV